MKCRYGRWLRCAVRRTDTSSKHTIEMQEMSLKWDGRIGGGYAVERVLSLLKWVFVNVPTRLSHRYKRFDYLKPKMKQIVSLYLQGDMGKQEAKLWLFCIFQVVSGRRLNERAVKLLLFYARRQDQSPVRGG